MKRLAQFAACLIPLGFAVPVSAQTVPQDVRCAVLSNLFAKTGSTPQNREVASQSLLFYLGRLDGRVNPATIAGTLRSQGRIDQKTAPAEMLACAQRLATAQRNLQNWGRAAQGNQPAGR